MAKQKKKSTASKEEYIRGSVAGFLGSGSVSSEAKDGGGGLSSFFKPSVVKQKSGPPANQVNEKIQQKGDTNLKAPSTTKRKRRDLSDDESEGRRKKKHHHSDTQEIQDPLVLARTLFVGNLPVDISKKEVKGLFKSYGTIESIRFRSMGVADLSMTKKVAAIKQELNPKRKSFNAYVVFKEDQCAQAALESNGTIVNKHHLRVDIAGNDKKHDMKRSLFVGNLPFDLADEELRTHFEEFGTVEGVRIIRDKATGVGKGFGYVLFEDSSSIQYALKSAGNKLKGRTLRIKRAVKKEKQKETRGAIASRGRGGQRRINTSGKAPTGPWGQKQGSRPSFKGKKKGQTQTGRPPFKGNKKKRAKQAK